MAKKAAAPQILSVPSSGGKGGLHLPWWGWVLVAGAAALVMAALAGGDAAIFIGLAFFGGWTVLAWVREKGNIVDSFRDWMLVLFLLMTAMAGAINGCAASVKTGFDTGRLEVGKNVKLPEFHVNEGTTSTSTTVPAPAPAAAPQ